MFGHRTPLQLTDLPVAVLLVLAVAGVGVYGIVLAGWSSGSTYPLLGGAALDRPGHLLRDRDGAVARRGVPLLRVDVDLGDRRRPEDLWFILPAFFSFAVYVVTMVGETNRLPFDLAEGEGELTGGFHTEYCSLKFAMFFLGEYVNMFTVSALATTMFLGGWRAPPGIAAINDGMFNHGWWGLLWFVIKLWMFMFFFVWLRGSLPRVRYDQFMRFGWKFLIPVTLLWVVAVAFIRGAPARFFDRRRNTPAGDRHRRRRHRGPRPRGRLGLGRPAAERRWRREPSAPRRSTRSRVATPCPRCPASACASRACARRARPGTAAADELTDSKEATRG